ncbi:hypothetical protein LQW54_004235 [Pestalotiopsis sp. IQ-011]
MPGFPALDKGEWVLRNYDALLAAIRRDDVYAITSFQAIGLKVEPVLPKEGPDSPHDINSSEIVFEHTVRKRKKSNNISQDKAFKPDKPITKEENYDNDSKARAKRLADYIMSTTDIYN